MPYDIPRPSGYRIQPFKLQDDEALVASMAQQLLKARLAEARAAARGGGGGGGGGGVYSPFSRDKLKDATPLLHTPSVHTHAAFSKKSTISFFNVSNFCSVILTSATMLVPCSKTLCKLAFKGNSTRVK